MPFEAAKAMAATFCYSIRYALVPLFGPDFVTMCLGPTDPKQGEMLISPKIIRDCRDEARRFRDEALKQGLMIQERPLTTSFRPPPAQTRGAYSVGPDTLCYEGVEKSYCSAAENKRDLPSPQPSQPLKRFATFFRDAGKPQISSDGNGENSQSSRSIELPPLIPSLVETCRAMVLLSQPRIAARAEPHRLEAPLMSNEAFKTTWTLVQLSRMDSSQREREPRPRKRRASS